MRKAIIVSEKDLAGMNIKDAILHITDSEIIDTRTYKLSKNITLYIIKKESIYANNIDKEIKADMFIFATKHKSSSNISCLSCHAPGNWGKAELGGYDRELCIAPAFLLKESFLSLNSLGKGLNYDITMECTHHGPYLEKPCFFIEIGSTEQEWKNRRAGKIIANVLLSVLNYNPRKDYIATFLIGGGHYNQAAKKIMLKTDYAVGHICPKYMLPFLTKTIITQAIERTSEHVKLILLDWKGLGKYKHQIVSFLEELNLEYERVNRIIS